MRSTTKALALTAMLIAGATAIPALYAQEPAPSGEQGSMMGQGGMSGMMGMMQMMAEMRPMMETCNKMMQAMMANEDADMPSMRPDASPLGSQDNG